ncbi:S-layer homology domain-containing protein [Sporosarcina sp. GW1-11]|uniref:S-layer homology domain-containing protein n=1 Tax=Sporosarcina sp. GW1-11 TaxID=2899126 RepID=UPI00294C95BD|nr:S-layer homology domain-containing protein [Sporosarcina sp. GW1-11]MDV6378885.1 S-layer homology domain-containing protein [Sporosarcina sp. GW1-11]
MKKIIRVVLFTALLFAVSVNNMGTGSAATKEFKDVPKKHPNYEAIQAIQEAGYISGYPDGTFRPSQSISRKHVAKLLDKALKLPDYTAGKVIYKDVPKNHAYYSSIMNLTEAGIFSGGLDGKFNPEAPITRIQMAKVLDLAYDFNMTTYDSFEDVNRNHWGYVHATALAASGVARGDQGRFYPNRTVTRAHYAEFLNRAIEAKKADPTLGKVTKNKAIDLSNRLTNLIEYTLIEGKRQKKTFAQIRPELLKYATSEFVEGNLREYYPYVCTECDQFLFPFQLRTEFKLRFDFTQTSPNRISVQTVEFGDGLAHGGFVGYLFKQDAGKWKMEDYTYDLVGKKNFKLTIEEAEQIIRNDYLLYNDTVWVTYKSKKQVTGKDIVSNEKYTYDVYTFTIVTDYGTETVEVDSDSGMYY